MQNKIRLGIIGKKFGYNVIYKSFLDSKKYKIKGFAFKSKNLQEIKIPKSVKVYSNWKDLVLDKKIDAVAIATPPTLHKRIIQFALKNNKHIFCEKPFTRSLKEATFICNLLKKKKNISHMVNYEFTEIDAFLFLKKFIIKSINIKKAYLNWFINLNNRSKKHWKESFSKGGGIIFNFFCHAIYYLEFLFGKVNAIKTDAFSTNKDKIKILRGTIFFKNNFSTEFNVKVGPIKEKIKPVHQLKILSNRASYILETNLNSLSDQFRLIQIGKNYKKSIKTLFKNKKNKNDFRIKPTGNNAKKFSNWILKGTRQTPNFFDAQRVHLIISKMMISSKKKRKIYV